MELPVVAQRADNALRIERVETQNFDEWVNAQSPSAKRWVETNRFKAAPGSVCLIPANDGSPDYVVAGMRAGDDFGSIAGLGNALGPVDLFLDPRVDSSSIDGYGVDGTGAYLAALGFALGTYRFPRYGKKRLEPARLALPDGVEMAALAADVNAITLVRDLINTPAADMMPEHLSDAAKALADRHGATFSEIVGDALLSEGYPTVHAVGRASTSPPRLLELTWGDPAHPAVTIVGKGVCFDSGGLDIKPAAGMRFMKKDMGGAAHALGVASWIMETGQSVSLRVLVPAVENAIAGNAFRPGDVLTTRTGRTVEVDNTDAEGRLILCDALAAAAEAEPEVIVDFATLTGAARVALGTDLPAMFCNNDDVAADFLKASTDVCDPIWRMPLHQPYAELLDSNIADVVNAGGGFGGAITAALFMEPFVVPIVPWVHFDLMAWNQRSRPGRPEGGEAMALRAVCATIKQSFAAK
jgi:leucyl aminopeptidase